MSLPTIKVIRAKFHGISVTDANLNYHGSITLDPEQCALAGILPLEFVDIWNKNSGARISTYVILGKPGSKCCILNGAAARTCQAGDEIIIAASYYCPPTDIIKFSPRILTFNKKNEIQEILEYNISQTAEESSNQYEFSIKNITNKHYITDNDSKKIIDELLNDLTEPHKFDALSETD